MYMNKDKRYLKILYAIHEYQIFGNASFESMILKGVCLLVQVPEKSTKEETKEMEWDRATPGGKPL